jgi:hypothetical protein
MIGWGPAMMRGPLSVRPALARPVSIAGRIDDLRTWGWEFVGWHTKPSDVSPASSHMRVFTPPVQISGGAMSIGPGLK